MKFFKKVLILGSVFITLLLVHVVYASDSTTPQVKVYNSDATKIVTQFLAYQESFTSGVNVACGDIDGDNTKEIVTAAGRDGSPQIRIFNKDGQWTGKSFLAFNKSFKGGVNIALGDINGDKKDEIIVGAGMGGGPQVKVFDQKNKLILQFFAYQKDFKGGVNVAVGDINGDGRGEIITSTGPSGGPHIRVFSGTGKDLSVNIFPYPKDFRGGINVAAGDVDGDKIDEIIVGPASDATSRIKIYEANKDRKILGEYIIYPESFEGGINVAAGDINSDGKEEIITAPALGGGPHVKAIDHKGKPLNINFLAYHKDFKGGVKVAAFDLDSNKKAEIITAPAPSNKLITKCKNRCVALTFDDGYSKGGSFSRILDILKARDVKATFFILGVVMQSNPELMKRITKEGHQLANHSYSHGWLTKMSQGQIRREIISTDGIAKSITGKPTKPYFRYPYGAHSGLTDLIVRNLGYKYYMWTATTGDTSKSPSTTNALYGALGGLHDGSIILGHTQSPYTAAALDDIITIIKRAGYNLVTIEEMP